MIGVEKIATSTKHLEYGVLLILCCFTLFQGITIPFNEPVADGLHYVRVASEIVQRQTLTDFGLSNEPGRFLPPLYPVFVAVPGFFDEAYRQSLDCYNNLNVSACSADALQTLGVMQACLICGMIFAVHSVAKNITGSAGVAILTIILFKFFSSFDNYMHVALTECLQFTLFSLVISGVIFLLERRGVNIWTGLFLGGSFGLLVLTRGSYLYLAYLLLPLVLFIKLKRESLSLNALCYLSVSVGASMLVVLSGWMIRNILFFGDPAISSGYAPFIFIQRLAYNDMYFFEWLTSFIYWFPDIGDNIARQYLPPESYMRLGWDEAVSFYQEGQRDRMELCSNISCQVSIMPLLVERLLPDLFWHCMVTLALSFRGIWAGGYLAVFGLLSLFWALRHLYQINRLWLIAVLAFILFFMVGFNGFFTVSIVRYNELLVLFYALCSAIVLCNLGLNLYKFVFLRKAGRG
jgi:hypothetical protein